MNLNRVDLIGRLTFKPEVKVGTNSRKFIAFTLAVNGYKTKSGETHTDFIRCILSGAPVDTFDKFATKGGRVRISGPLTVTTSTKEGKTYENTYVSVSEFEFLDFGNTQSEQEKPTEKTVTTTPTASKSAKETPSKVLEDVEEISDDDLPF